MTRVMAASTRALRVQLAIATGSITVPELHKAARLTWNQLQLAESATTEERNAQSYVGLDDAFQLVVGPSYSACDRVMDSAHETLTALDTAVAHAKRNLDEQSTQTGEALGEALAAAIRPQAGEQQKEMSDKAEVAEDFLTSMFLECALAGVACDGCEMHGSLRTCQRCSGVFYCSAQCQRSDWKARHRRQCRQQGVFKLGDLVTITKRADSASADVDRSVGMLVEQVSAGEWHAVQIGPGAHEGPGFESAPAGTSRCCCLLGKMTASSSEMELHSCTFRNASDLATQVANMLQVRCKAA